MEAPRPAVGPAAKAAAAASAAPIPRFAPAGSSEAMADVMEAPEDTEDLAEAPPLGLLVPKSVVKAVVGRDGANLDEVAEATGCTVRDANGTMFDDKVLLLYGSGRDQLAAIERLWRLVAAAQMLVYTYPHPGGRLGIPPIRFLIPADSVGAVVGAGGLGLREINAALAESGASVQVEPQPLLAPTGATTSTYGRSGKELAVAAHGSIDAAVRATQLVLERVDGYSAATWSAPQDVVQPGNASFAEALKSVQQRAAKLFGK